MTSCACSGGSLDAEGWPFGDAFKLLLLTGQRRDEVTGMRWREVNLDAQTWTIAKDRCKNGKAHTIDLCPEALRFSIGWLECPTMARQPKTEDRLGVHYHRTNARQRVLQGQISH